MPNIALPKQAVHYRDEGAGTPLLMLSANPGDSRDFDAIAPQLAQRYRVIRMDWPGYGGSPVPQPPEQAGASYFLDCFGEFIDALGLERFHILGNSVGGNVAVRYALAQPRKVLSLALVSSGGFTRHNPVTRLFCQLQGMPRFNRLIGGLFTRSYLHTRNDWTRAMIARGDGEQNTSQARRVNAAVWRSFLQPQHNLLEQARGIALPALVINGRRDPVIPAKTDGRNAAQAIPGARALVLDSGHAPFAEIPEEFLAHLQPFLAAAEQQHGAR
ncbi:MAG: alpha/beta fold hydrolase [Stenotrophobium sp.]